MRSLALLVSALLVVVFASFCLALYAALRQKASSSLFRRFLLTVPCVLSTLGGVWLSLSLDATAVRISGLVAAAVGVFGLVKLWGSRK